MNEQRRDATRQQISHLDGVGTIAHAMRISSLLAALALLAPSLASAAASVYHSPGDNGSAATEAVAMASGATETFYLWIHKGNTASGGDECITGSGDEICAYDVEVTLDGDTTISFWDPDDSTVIGDPSPDGKSLRVNRIVDSPDTTPVRIGTMDVFVTGTAGRVDVSGRHIIDAAQELEGVASNNIAVVPEPAQIVMLLSGLLGLRGLAALRRG